MAGWFDHPANGHSCGAGFVSMGPLCNFSLASDVFSHLQYIDNINAHYVLSSFSIEWGGSGRG